MQRAATTAALSLSCSLALLGRPVVASATGATGTRFRRLVITNLRVVRP